jgi:hypothetical protein
MKLDLTDKKELRVFASAFKSREMELKTKHRVEKQNYTAVGTRQETHV